MPELEVTIRDVFRIPWGTTVIGATDRISEVTPLAQLSSGCQLLLDGQIVQEVAVRGSMLVGLREPDEVTVILHEPVEIDVDLVPTGRYRLLLRWDEGSGESGADAEPGFEEL